MDIRCPICGEPWDMDELHEVYDGETHVPFKKAYARFMHAGCETFYCSHNEVPDVGKAQAAQVLMEIMGDDVDGVAADLEDFDYLGLI